MKISIKSIIPALLVVVTVYSCAKSGEKKKPVDSDFRQELAMPEFTLISIKDSTVIPSSEIDKEGYILLKYFSPDCEHCQKEAEFYLKRKDSFTNIRTLWMSGDWATLAEIKKFVEDYKIDQTNPVAIGKEHKSTLIQYYDLKGVPYAAVYKDNQLVQEFRRSFNYSILTRMNRGTFKPQPKDSMTKLVQSWSKKQPAN